MSINNKKSTPIVRKNGKVNPIQIMNDGKKNPAS